MSRSANVTLIFQSDLAQAEQQYEAFVRKVSQPIKVPLSAEGVTGAGTPTTFATGNVPGASPASGGDGRLLAAIDRLTAQIGRGGSGSESSPVDRIFSRWGEPATNPSGYSPIRGGRWGPGRGFNSGIESLLAQESGGGGGGDDASPDPGRGRSRFQRNRLVTQSFLLHEAGNFLRANQEEGQEERLAVGAGGSVDLQRQLTAQRAYVNRIESLPVVGQIAGYVAGLTGIGEGTTRTLDDASRQDRITGQRQGLYDYIRTGHERDYVSAGEGSYDRARRGADVEGDRELRKVKKMRDDMVEANRSDGNFDTTEPDAFLAVAKREIQRGYDQTLKDIAKQYQPVFTRLSAEIPIIAEQAQGNLRASARDTLKADIMEGVELEQDPGLRDLKRRIGQKRLNAFDTRQGEEDKVTAGELDARTESSRQAIAGDERGSLISRQRARRIRTLGPPSDDPNRAALGASLDAQDALELREQGLQGLYRTRSLDAGERVSGLLAQRRPIGAQVEDIYSRGTAAAQQSQDAGRLQDALPQLRTTKNQLEALRNEILLGGQGVEVAAGAYAKGGTEGSGEESVISALQELGKKLDDINNKIGNLSSD